MAFRLTTDPETGDPVEVTMSYDEWVWYTEWIKGLVERGLPIPKLQRRIEAPIGLPDFGDPVAFQRRLRDGDD